MADKETAENARIGEGKPGPGRPRGSANKATAAVRDAFQALVEANQSKLQAALDEVYRKDKAGWFDMMMGLAEYVVPKLARTETTLEGSLDLGAQLIIKRRDK